MTPTNDPGGSEVGGAGVGTELTNKGTIRQKRWTTRGRTGCLTCRARHIKCDETKPACRRCATSRRECRGYDFGSDPDMLTAVAARQSKQDATTDAQCVRGLVQEVVAWRQHIDEPEPPDWECMEAVRYYLVFVLPCCDEQFMAPPFTGLPPCHGPNRPIFLVDVSCHRIADAARARGRLLRAREDASVDGAWAAHSRHMIQILSALNRGISSDKGLMMSRSKKEALRRILTLLYFDLIVDASTWRPHLVGYLALVQHMGGVRALMRENDGYINSTQWSILVIAIAANTTSPASKQLCGFEAYTDEDILLLSALDTSPDLACPPPLLVIVKNLTQLRGRIADGRCTKISLNTELRDLFDRIGAFDYNAWAFKQVINSKPAGEAVISSTLVSHMFQVAARLFGVLSLPHSATVSWAGAAGYQRLPGMSMYDSVRIAHRCELLDMLYRFRGRFRTALALAWPVTVAGVSLGGDGASVEDRAFVAEALLDMWMSRLSRCGPILCLQKLRAFWDSGKTEWDDCFDEPVPPLA
ncbi:C6 zinc finger domain protein [Beauveria brongniartii RCEF 3172]|uniref:C6 zinc finger domain protein n=1 Tax=Beauveria brongniartii RCEF 3172 TaxID=1081107 RepID=A0A162LYS3_9HYPO|nr:C6 zinc finger domain protein [Beauveria brongniartii RCEF 3172]